MYSKTCVKRPLSKRPKISFQNQLLLNAGQKYCRMLQGEHSAILSTFIKLPIAIKIFVLSIFERLFYTGFTVMYLLLLRSISLFKFYVEHSGSVGRALAMDRRVASFRLTAVTVLCP